VEIPNQIPSECREGDKPVEGDLWAGAAPSEGLSASEKARWIVHHWTDRECSVSSETREAGIGEIVPVCGVRGEVIELNSVN